MEVARDARTWALNIRYVPADVMDSFTQAAKARGMSHAEYLGALVELHGLAMRVEVFEPLLERVNLTEVKR